MRAPVGNSEDPLPPATQLGDGRWSRRVVEAIDACLRLQERRRSRNCQGLLGMPRQNRTAPEDIPFGPRVPLRPAGTQMSLASVPPREGAGELLGSGLRSWGEFKASGGACPRS